MLDFCAKGADGVTVRLVTDFVVVFRMAGGLPSLALVATGDELRNVFMVAVVLAPWRGFPLWMREGAAGGRSLRWALRRRSGGAPSVGCRRVLRSAESGSLGPWGARRAPGWAPKGFVRPRAPVSQRTAAGCGVQALPFFL